MVAKYLQPLKLTHKDLKVEVRKENGKQFESKLIRSLFEQNYIQHTFTIPYTPEENGHIESFHSILSKALEKDEFFDIKYLGNRLKTFYPTYDNDRSHSGTMGIPAAKFWALFDFAKIEVIKDM